MLHSSHTSYPSQWNVSAFWSFGSDLDYLSQVPPLVAMLGVSAQGMRHNPLMLENSLGERNETPPETERNSDAAADAADGSDTRALEKARLRRAEAVLVLEEERATAQHYRQQMAVSAPASLSDNNGDMKLVPPALDATTAQGVPT
jgi:hypothetical protein